MVSPVHVKYCHDLLFSFSSFRAFVDRSSSSLFSFASHFLPIARTKLSPAPTPPSRCFDRYRLLCCGGGGVLSRTNRADVLFSSFSVRPLLLFSLHSTPIARRRRVDDDDAGITRRFVSPLTEHENAENAAPREDATATTEARRRSVVSPSFDPEEGLRLLPPSRRRWWWWSRLHDARDVDVIPAARSKHIIDIVSVSVSLSFYATRDYERVFSSFSRGGQRKPLPPSRRGVVILVVRGSILKRASVSVRIQSSRQKKIRISNTLNKTRV